LTIKLTGPCRPSQLATHCGKYEDKERYVSNGCRLTKGEIQALFFGDHFNKGKEGQYAGSKWFLRCVQSDCCPVGQRLSSTFPAFDHLVESGCYQIK
jgi:hypothetical protein